MKTLVPQVRAGAEGEWAGMFERANIPTEELGGLGLPLFSLQPCTGVGAMHTQRTRPNVFHSAGCCEGPTLAPLEDGLPSVGLMPQPVVSDA